jgi:small-conductance mechanosensitive channel
MKALNEAGIEIPFPQRDLHIKEAAIRREEAKEMPATTPLAQAVPGNPARSTRKEQVSRPKHQEDESERL